MAIVKCSECGRAISDKASVCVGCGAPLAQIPGFNLVPKPSTAPPPTYRQLRWHAALASLTLIIGVIWTSSIERQHQPHGITSTVAALVIICGLCWLVATIFLHVSARK